MAPKKKNAETQLSSLNTQEDIGFLPPGCGNVGSSNRSSKGKKNCFGYRFEPEFPVPPRLYPANRSLVEAVNDFHYAMMNDTDRNEFYYDMLKQHVTPDTGVLEIGAGSGLLSIMAGKLGAKWVVAVEGSKELSRLAEANIKENNLEDRVKVMNLLSTELLPEYLPGKPDILVCEIFGTFLLGESALDYIRDARERLLPKNAVILPQKGVQYAIPISCPTLESICSVTSWNGIQLSHMQALQDTVSTCFTKEYGFRLSSVPLEYLAEPVKLLEVDFATDTRSSFPRQKLLSITPKASGRVHAWLYYWKVTHPGCAKVMSTFPEDTRSNFPRDLQWGQALQLVEERIEDARPNPLFFKEGEPHQFTCFFSADRVLMTMKHVSEGISKKERNELENLHEAMQSS